MTFTLMNSLYIMHPPLSWHGVGWPPMEVICRALYWAGGGSMHGGSFSWQLFTINTLSEQLNVVYIYCWGYWWYRLLHFNLLYTCTVSLYSQWWGLLNQGSRVQALAFILPIIKKVSQFGVPMIPVWCTHALFICSCIDSTTWGIASLSLASIFQLCCINIKIGLGPRLYLGTESEIIIIL